MPVTHLHIQQFRNLAKVDCCFNSYFNLVLGDNGSGKTSLLEAIYYLSRARSFRSHRNARIVQHGCNQFLLQAQFNHHKLGIQRQLSPQNLQIRLDEQHVHSTSALAKHLPILLIYYDSFHLIAGGPEYRRRLIDWGVFHVEHPFVEQWHKYTRVLKQRNLALKNNDSPTLVQAWDKYLVEYGEYIASSRARYLQQLQPYINTMLQMINVDWTVSMDYQQGIPKGYTDLATAISDQLTSDYRLGYTQSGPHRADLKLSVNNQPAKDVLSRGQQKALILAIYLAQSQLFADTQQRSPILLIDDLGAEFDQERLKQAFNLLKQQSAQVFITAIDSYLLPVLDQKECSMFHVEHGKIHKTT